jgi:hypothetical protein
LNWTSLVSQGHSSRSAENASACRPASPDCDPIAPEGQDWLEAYEETLQQALHPAILRAAE